MEHNRFCVSFMAALCFIVITQSLISVGFGQVLCPNPLNIGELRVKNSKYCVDIDGTDGWGDVQATTCDGYLDQQIIICGDGTIRNKKRNSCLQATGSGNANVESTSCFSISSRKRWRKGRTKRFVDTGGISQEATELINLESNKCLDVSGLDGTGNIGVSDCENRDDQYFYIRSRGRELKFGRLRNEASNLCIDVAGIDGQGDVAMYNCEEHSDQWFRFYQNGELVNEKSHYCLDIVNRGGEGNVGMSECEDQTDQMWRAPPALCNGEYCSFVSKKSGNCLDVSGLDGRGNVGAYNCEGLSDQRFKWVTGKWVTPTATWNQVGCNQNGQVSQQISNSITYSKSVTATILIEISSTIGVSAKFLSAEVSTKVSTSLATTLSTSSTSAEAITFTCENYDSGEEFIRGCMWQLQVDTSQVSSGRQFTWTPQIVKCTRSNTAPVCPPFTKCVNQDCTECTDL